MKPFIFIFVGLLSGMLYASELPTWDAWKRYMGGDRVIHNGIAYEALPASNLTWDVYSPPDWTATLWKRLPTEVQTPPPLTTIPQEWSEHHRYMSGERVSRYGKYYEATELSNQPGVYNVWSYPEWTPNLWKQIKLEPMKTDWGTIELVDSPKENLETGGAVTYWAESNEWGIPSQWVRNVDFSQKIGVSPKVGPNGEVGFAMAWDFPVLSSAANPVLTAPGLIMGFKPGSKTGNHCVRWNDCLRKLDGTLDQRTPQNGTLNSPFPITVQGAIDRGLKVHQNHKYIGERTGHSHVAWEFWLQSHPGQDFGFVNASITHEILIPISNTGLYGDHYMSRNRKWYDHDVTIDGRLYHVYAMGKNGGRNPVNGWNDYGGTGPGGIYPGFHYTWPSLEPNGRGSGPDAPGRYGRPGWKFIVLQPAVLPIQGEIDFAKVFAYLLTVKDEIGQPWLDPNFFVVSGELMAETVSGKAHVQVEDLRIWNSKP